jgi:hypothetical protein
MQMSSHIVYLLKNSSFSNFLQIGTHVLFDLCETTMQIQLMNNQICSKFHKINPNLKLHQKIFSLNKSIANQPNLFKSTKIKTLLWNQLCLGSFMEVLE